MGLRQKVSAVYANMTFNDLDSQPLIWWISPAIEFFGELKNTIYAYALEAVRSQNSSSRSLDTAKKNPGWNSVCSRAHFTGDTFKKELKTNRPLRPWAEAAECEIVQYMARWLLKSLRWTKSASVSMELVIEETRWEVIRRKTSDAIYPSIMWRMLKAAWTCCDGWV